MCDFTNFWRKKLSRMWFSDQKNCLIWLILALSERNSKIESNLCLNPLTQSVSPTYLSSSICRQASWASLVDRLGIWCSIAKFVCKILTKHEKKRWDIRPTEREYRLWIMARAKDSTSKLLSPATNVGSAARCSVLGPGDYKGESRYWKSIN